MDETAKTNEKVNIVGVRFKKAGRVYYYDPAGIEFKSNDNVVVNTPRGQKLGTVVIAPEQVLASELAEPLKPVTRKGTPEDAKRVEELATKEPEVLSEAAKMIQKLNLQMKLITAEYNLEGNHLTLCFKAAERVDFRELVKELNSYFKVRVELRQVGPRDEAKLVGGYGRCGRPLCCAAFLDEFAPVSIKMAKQQSLPLNPMKIAGSCGRLLCCLAYEAEPTSGKPAKTQETPVEEELESLEEIPAEEASLEHVSAQEIPETSQEPSKNSGEVAHKSPSIPESPPSQKME